MLGHNRQMLHIYIYPEIFKVNWSMLNNGLASRH